MLIGAETPQQPGPWATGYVLPPPPPLARPKPAPPKPQAILVAPKKPFPWKWAMVAGGLAVAGYFYWQSSRRPQRSNPSAEKFYEDFHWGRKAKRKTRARLSAIPRALAKLGTLEAVTYSTKKGGEKLADYIHHFSKPKPALAGDPKTRKLHIVGGGYDIKPEGIDG